MDHRVVSRTANSCIVSALIATLFILHPPLAQAQTPRFLPAVSYDSGGYLASSVVLGDLNGDGILDIVVSHRCAIGDTCPNGEGYVCWSSEYCSHGAVGVLLGNGDGTFRAPVTYESDGYLTRSMRLGDLNGDGNLDAVVVNSCGTLPDSDENCPYGTVDMMFGNGDGTFGGPWSRVVHGWYPVSVALGNLNSDGKLDAAVATVCRQKSTCSETGCTCETGSAEILDAGGLYDSGGPWGRSVALGDVNRDGKVDVIVANNSSIGVLLGKGDDTLQPALSYPPGGVITANDSVIVDDVNGDGIPDALVASTLVCSTSPCTFQGLVGVLLGNGDGTFQPTVTYSSGGSFARSVVVSDVNGDSKPDLIVANVWSVGVLLGKGDGTFQAAMTFSIPGLNNSVAVGDLNGDGKPDLVVASGGVSVLLNDSPFCTKAPTIALSTAPTSLWPPNGKMVPVTVSGAITNADKSCTVKAASYVVKDEYAEVQPTGLVKFGTNGEYSFTIWLQASRFGSDLNGRSYEVTVIASNNGGKTGSKLIHVIVPHDQGH